MKQLIAPAIEDSQFRGLYYRQTLGAGATIASSSLGYAVERNIATREQRNEFGKGSFKRPSGS